MVIFSPYKTVISSEYINYFMKQPDTQRLTLLESRESRHNKYSGKYKQL